MNNSNYFYNLKSFNDTISKKNYNFFNIISVNVRSISSINKFNKFKSVLSNFHKLPDIIAIQETWFSKDCVNLYSIPGYCAVHCCRGDGYGGTSFYLANNLSYKLVLNSSDEFLNVVALELPAVILNNKPLRVTSLYRSQKCNFEKFYDKLENMLETTASGSCLILGDFNVDLLSSHSSGTLIKNLFAEFGLFSCHNLVTRPQSSTSIDCIFGNLIPSISVCSIENRLTDHNI